VFRRGPYKRSDLLLIWKKTAYEFQIMLRSLMPTFSYDLYTSFIFCTPSSSVSCVLKTAASVCIVFCMFNRICAVDSGPLEFRILSNSSMLSLPRSPFIGV